MTDRRDRSDRLRKRFEDEGDEGDETDGRSDESSAETGGSSAKPTAGASEDGDTTGERTGEHAGEEDAGGGGASVKDRPSVLMYLPEDTRRELDIRFDELNARHKRAHGEPLEKNRDYYPAVIEAGLSDEAVEEILDL
jgi:hypothetical protein